MYTVGISSEQFAVMEQKLEKAAATEKALRAEVQMWKTDLNKVSTSRLHMHIRRHKPLILSNASFCVMYLFSTALSCNVQFPLAICIVLCMNIVCMYAVHVCMYTACLQCCTTPFQPHTFVYTDCCSVCTVCVCIYVVYV